jgi:D-serine deaminase-like pyridoxal phosphate-dependent protein
VTEAFDRLDPAAYALPRSLAAELQSPALILHRDRVRENLRRVIALCGGDPDRWRPHLKSSKIPEIWAELVRAGLRHFKVATTREAAVLAQLLLEQRATGAEVLLAHPLVGPALQRYARIAEEHPSLRFALLFERAEDVAEVPEPLALFLDLNCGMDRTGLPLAERAEILLAARAAGSRLTGLHCYEGHRHEPDPDERRELAFADYRRLCERVGELVDAGLRVEEIVTSGTPAFRHALEFEPFARMEGVRHRVSPGTVVFHDLRSEEESPELGLAPAALVFTRVVSRPTGDVVTCDAGSKAIAAEAGDPCAAVLGRPELVPMRPSEEHLPLHVRSGRAPTRGSELLLVPRHVCPTVNLAEQAVLLEGGELVGLVEVRARAHETLPDTWGPGRGS